VDGKKRQIRQEGKTCQKTKGGKPNGGRGLKGWDDFQIWDSFSRVLVGRWGRHLVRGKMSSTSLGSANERGRALALPGGDFREV